MKDLPSISSNNFEPQWRPLHQAIYNGELEKVKTLLSQGVNWRESLFKEGEIDNAPKGKRLYHHTSNALEVAVVRQDPESVTGILSCAEIGKDDLYVQKAYNKSLGFQNFNVQLAFSSYGCPKIIEAIERSIIELASEACIAISENSRTKLTSCLRKTELCLQVSGKTSPLHHALREGKYGFFKAVYFEFITDKIASEIGRKLDDSESRQCILHGKKQLEDISSHIYDEYQRTFSFRLERVEKKATLNRELAGSKSWFDRYKIFNRMNLYHAQRMQIALADQWHLKMVHSAKIQNNPISKVGQNALAAIRPISIIATAGVPRYALHFAWTQGMSYTKQYVMKKLGEVHPYVPYALDNFLTYCLVPEYYVASTVLGTGVYWGFKDSGYDNAEALTQLVVDGVAYSATVGSKSSYEVDDRYQYNLNNNLTAIFGEKAANMMTPVIASVDSFSNQANRAINGTVNLLGNYFSQSSVAQLTELISLPENISKLGSYAESGIESVRSLQESWMQVEQRILNEFEAPLVSIMNDSTFKQNRLHALALVESHRLLAQLSEMNQQLEKAKSESADVQAAEVALTKKQAEVDTAIAEAERLFKLTEGYACHQIWRDAYAALKLQECQKHANATVIDKLREVEQKALAKSRFYNNDIVNQVNDLWSKDLDELMNLSKKNFIDNTNIVGTITEMIANAFSFSTDNPNQRNEIARHCADEIIRYKYPYYPSIGDKGAIEAERQGYLQEITNHELQGFPKNRSRMERRLYDYIYAKLSGTPKKPHIPRHISMYKSGVNEIIGKTLGYIPYPEHKGGKSEKANISLQFSKNGMQTAQVNVAVNNIPVYNIYGANRKATVELSVPTLKEAANASSQSVQIRKVPSTGVQSVPAGKTKLEMDNPYLQPILDEQFESTFGLAKSAPRGKVQPKSDIDAKNNKAPRTKTALTTAANDASSFLPQIRSKAKLDPWWEMALRSARGETSKEIIAWRKNNQMQPPEWVMAASKIVSHQSMQLSDIPVLFSDALGETLVETVEGMFAIGQFSVDELGRMLRGETLQSKRAVLMVGYFIGQEAARVMLNEKTETSKYIQGLAAEYDHLDSKGKAKLLFRISLAIFLPSLGVKVVNQSGKMMVQKANTVMAGKHVKAVKAAPLPKAVSNKNVIPKVFPGTATGAKQGEKQASLLTMFEGKVFSKSKEFNDVLISRSTPAEIFHGYGELTKRQAEILAKLPESRNYIILRKNQINVADITSLTAKTGVEFAMFTLGPRRIIIRGTNERVIIPPKLLDKISSEKWTWSAHVHPGTTDLVLQASGVPGDRQMLEFLRQKNSMILNSAGRRNVFDAHDNQFVSKNSKIVLSDTTKKSKLRK